MLIKDTQLINGLIKFKLNWKNRNPWHFLSLRRVYWTQRRIKVSKCNFCKHFWKRLNFLKYFQTTFVRICIFDCPKRSEQANYSYLKFLCSPLVSNRPTKWSDDIYLGAISMSEPILFIFYQISRRLVENFGFPTIKFSFISEHIWELCFDYKDLWTVDWVDRYDNTTMSYRVWRHL